LVEDGLLAGGLIVLTHLSITVLYLAVQEVGFLEELVVFSFLLLENLWLV